jgi:hypothetical protein
MLAARVPMNGFVLECCSGDGAIATALQNTVPKKHLVETNDLDPKWDADQHGDATDVRWWMNQTCNWVVTNPPFNVAAKILPLAFERAFNGVAMLLRLSYLEPCAGRGRWLVKHPPTRLIVLPRISFTGDGKTDNVTCAWYVWERNDYGQQSLEVVPPTIDGQIGLFDGDVP